MCIRDRDKRGVYKENLLAADRVIEARISTYVSAEILHQVGRALQVELSLIHILRQVVSMPLASGNKERPSMSVGMVTSAASRKVGRISRNSTGAVSYTHLAGTHSALS